tara:strand:+ start:10751 stop:11290 length:540 start_codon:yes stop_codon:yes gene_type:complete
MLIKKLNIDLNAVTFKGLSSSKARMASVILSFIIFLSVLASLFSAGYLASVAGQIPDWIFLLGVSALLIEYILTSRTSLETVASILVDAMPMSILFRRDKVILERGRVELERVLSDLDLAVLNGYSTINPSISVSISDQLIDICRRGELKTWLNEPKQLASAANLIYQVYITEEFVTSC